MSKKSKIFHFFNRIVTFVDDKSKGIIKYDTDNLFPQKLIRQIGESGTATSCVEVISQYIYADGLVDEVLGKEIANEKQTYNQLISELSNSVSILPVVCLHIQRDGQGKIISKKAIPFDKIRVAEDGNYIYNPTYSLDDKFDASKDVKYCKFQGEKVDSKQLKEIISFKNKNGKSVGEILYHFKKKPGQTTYPIPSCWSGISDIDADGENSKFELEAVNNSFLPSGFLTFVGSFDDKTEDEHGKTEWDYIDDTCSNFTGNSKDNKGETKRNSLAVFTAPTKEELPVYQPASTDGVFDAIELSSKRVAEKIARLFGVPPFLIGLGGSVGFSTNIISDNITLFNNRIKQPQNLITEALTMCDSTRDFTLTQLNPVKYIAPEIYAKLTDAELRDLAGYKTDETKSNSTVSLAQTLGVGSTQSLVEIIKDALLTPDQKINTLIVLFNLSEENAKKLVTANVIPSINN